jgi:5-methyltetrahydrofolate--homocysteine methyltransferase
VLVSDGAWGTLLLQHGLQPGDCPERWCLEHADTVREIAAAYVEAGADLIETNSFGANRFKLGAYGLAESVTEINRAAARLSREAAGENVGVLASVGPTGCILTLGDVSQDAVYEAYAEQIRALAEGGADAICIETMLAIDEACLAIRAAREQSDCEVICTFTFERTLSSGYRTIMGDSPTAAAAAALSAGADVIGSNCGNGFAGMIEIVTELRAEFADAPILVHANAGLPSREDGVDRFPETPADMAAQVPALVAAGANIIGGCCGTTPAHIVALSAAVRSLRD